MSSMNESTFHWITSTVFLRNSPNDVRHFGQNFLRTDKVTPILIPWHSLARSRKAWGQTLLLFPQSGAPTEMETSLVVLPPFRPLLLASFLPSLSPAQPARRRAIIGTTRKKNWRQKWGQVLGEKWGRNGENLWSFHLRECTRLEKAEGYMQSVKVSKRVSLYQNTINFQNCTGSPFSRYFVDWQTPDLFTSALKSLDHWSWRYH